MNEINITNLLFFSDSIIKTTSIYRGVEYFSTLAMPAKDAYNGSKIQCGSGDSTAIEWSMPATMTIEGILDHHNELLKRVCRDGMWIMHVAMVINF